MNLDPAVAAKLPHTYELLQAGSLVLHPAVSRVVLHGSRGPAGGFRPDSDLDLSLIVDVPEAGREEQAALLQEVLDTSLDAWKGPVELDLAAVFDTRGCGLTCFDVVVWDEKDGCTLGGVDCFGLYKTQKGFSGFVEGLGIQVRLMQPCLLLWKRGRA